MYYIFEHLCPTKTKKRERVCGLVRVRGGRGKNRVQRHETQVWQSERVDTRKTHLFCCYRFSASGPKYHYCKCQRCEWNQPQHDCFEWLVKETRKFLQEQACPSWPPILPVSFVALPLFYPPCFYFAFKLHTISNVAGPLLRRRSPTSVPLR